MAAGEGYDEQLKACGKEGLSIEDSYWRLVVDDVGTAADLLRPVYDATGGADGFVSVEVSPDLAHDTDAHDRAGEGALRSARSTERHDQDPGDRRRTPRDPGEHRRRDQHQRDARSSLWRATTR